jgi:hypothetical protein
MQDGRGGETSGVEKKRVAQSVAWSVGNARDIAEPVRERKAFGGDSSLGAACDKDARGALTCEASGSAEDLMNQIRKSSYALAPVNIIALENGEGGGQNG